MEDERPEELGKRRVWELEGVMGRGSAPGCHLPSSAQGHGTWKWRDVSCLITAPKGQRAGIYIGYTKVKKIIYFSFRSI